jgi:predicted regulator of Ras-like GTPase activity (Roadblock/LC7/MglB family)
MGVVEAAIKQGKVSFTWQAMRSWFRPPLPPEAASAHDGTTLDLPLKVVIPLFLAELKSPKPQKKFVLEDDEPDVFSAARPPETASAPTATAAPAATPKPAPAAHSAPPAPVFTVRTPPPTPAPAAAPSSVASKTPDTNYFAWTDSSEEFPEDTAIFVKKGASPGTAFLNRYATPNQIVEKAAALEGVDGTLIALPDGLLVASRIPPTMNADTIAAFLPQIFGRVSQCTRELRLGDLNNLNFTVGNIPWKIFKVGSIYFAAFGRPGEPLPSAKLAVIAAELDRKAK